MPGTGYPRQLLAVDGTTQFASVIWDVGLPTEKALSNGLFGTSYFQIPADAEQGTTHPVAIRNSAGTSATKQVTVLQARGVFPSPRIEDIGVFVAGGSGSVDVALTVTAANLDVDATVAATQVVEGHLVVRTIGTTARWGALPVDYLQHHQPETFGYPVYHYTQLLSVVEGVTLGSSLQITVTNTDGNSATKEYILPGSLSDLDSDGDGLLDSWEESSYPVPGTAHTVPLAAMGTNKWRKDILVEVDWIPDATPDGSVWPMIEDVFRNAPVLNPDGSKGVNIIIDHGQGGALSHGGETLTDHDCLTFDDPPPPAVSGCTLTGFYSYKAQHFDQDRLRIFHYGIFGRKQVTGNSGNAERHGNDFFVTLLGALLPNSANVQMGTFVHELGHNLGFSHGDLKSDDQNFEFKPNLPSVMNYRYTAFGVDVNCTMFPGGVYTFSQGTLASIDEATVAEKNGICDVVPVDMDRDGMTSSVGVDFDGQNGKRDRWDDFDQWGNLLLKFDVPGSHWYDN